MVWVFLFRFICFGGINSFFVVGVGVVDSIVLIFILVNFIFNRVVKWVREKCVIMLLSLF